MYICFYEVSCNQRTERLDYEPAACLKADEAVMFGCSNVKVTKIEMEQHNTYVSWYKESIAYIPPQQY